MNKHVTPATVQSQEHWTKKGPDVDLFYPYGILPSITSTALGTVDRSGRVVRERWFSYGRSCR